MPRYTDLEFILMTPQQRHQAQDRIAREYLEKMRRRDQEQERNRLLAKERMDEESAAVEAAVARPTSAWSNGPCVYCGYKADTEMRSMGPIHLTRCLARYNTDQRNKHQS